ncbi:aminoglycoside phosphotransferase family protein [Paenibacillus sp. GCM10028914]|uniref:aminoglycoside phosphotransferase family protein n=1 Tax=Paenibacillus sp. GCM10028914 TaxID=3273416 RepID=UPI00360FB5D9
MSYLFQKTINNWNAWGAVYQSIEDFRPLIEKIFTNEHLLGAEHISHLKPGTNAVFKVGSYVIKIFAPTESGLNTDQDYTAEQASMQRAIHQGVRTPSIVATGEIVDKYVFKYLIMDYIEGDSAGDVLGSFTMKQKSVFIERLQLDMEKLNTEPDEEFSPAVIIERSVYNERWNILLPEVRLQVAEFLNRYEIQTFVHVHGDLTDDNVLIDSNEFIYIIDFADSTIAPIEYEYPPIIFELLRCDIEGVEQFIKGLNMKYNEFIERLFAGTMLHDYGANFVKSIYEKYTEQEIGSLSDIYEFKRLIHKHLMPNSLST